MFVLGIIIAIIVYIVFGYYRFNTVVNDNTTEIPLEDSDTTEDGNRNANIERDTVVDTDDTAYIEGSVGYPSDYIPDSLEVCAENIRTFEEYCTSTFISDTTYSTGFGYILTVPAGTYYVYAVNPDMDPDYRAYYSEFVTCGLSVECDSHDPIRISLLPGQTKTEIDPTDWYGQ